MWLILLAAVTAAGVLFGCDARGSPGAGNDGGAAPEADVYVDVGERSISVGPSTVPAGDVLFAVRNTSAIRDHELVLLKTDLAPEDLRISLGVSQVDESESGRRAGYIPPGRLPPGGSTTETFTLAPGSYVLLCNTIGHYEEGMHTEFTVR
ncbi:MAG: hypothetical protein WD533_01955 [Dehalococcoidia bacterium]